MTPAIIRVVVMYTETGGGQSTDVVSFPVVSRSETDPDGTYQLTYVVYQVGRYQLTVRHDGRHIDGSPFTVVAREELLKLTSSNPSISESTPQTDTNTIHDRTPQQLATRTTTSVNRSKTCGAMKRPASSPPCNRSCASARQRNTGIQRQNTIQCVSTDRYNCTSTMQTKRRQKTISYPTIVPPGKTAGCNGDCMNNDVTVIVNNMGTMECDETAAGSHSAVLLRVGRQGRNKGEFVNPQGVCCTKDGLILVADSNNACVQVRRIFNVGRSFNYNDE